MRVEVTAVIPTRNRPDLVCRAVQSVLSQTFVAIEAIVVVDGPDPATERALTHFSDARLRVVSLKENVGGCEARNIGVRLACGQWIAFLDDDDEWLPAKIAKQIVLAKQHNQKYILISSLYIDRMTNGDLVRPRTFPKPGQAISDFLWSQPSLFGGIEGFPQTSTWLLSRELILDIPFTPGLRCLQDLDWLLRGLSVPNVKVELVREPLVVFHNEATRERVAKKIDWRFSYNWARSNRSLFTPKAYAYFLVIYCLNPAAREKTAYKELLSVLNEGRLSGRLTLKAMALSFLYVFIYPSLRSLVSVPTQRRFVYRLTHLFAK
jgi:glycosyltransferase involved in cell wall biosynthesis